MRSTLSIDRRKRDREDNAVWVVSLQMQFAPVSVDDASGNRQAQTSTAFLCGEEGLKDAIYHPDRNRRTRILNPDLKSLPGLLRGYNLNAAAQRRCFNGVPHQVQKCLLQLAFIALYATGIAHLEFNL
jgi:hypothetical protein